MLRTLAGAVLALLLVSVPAVAQDQPAPSAPVVTSAQAAGTGEIRDNWAFGYMSPGYTNDPKKVATWHVGGGYEWLFAGHAGLSLGLGLGAAAVEGFEWNVPVDVTGSFYFGQAPVGERSLIPFISAGYTRGGFSKTSNMLNIGAGFNQWTQGWSGFRFEVRHHISDERGPNGRNWFLDVRFGFVG
jgi:hypothetical protein